jgi:hypothetical protein
LPPAGGDNPSFLLGENGEQKCLLLPTEEGSSTVEVVKEVRHNNGANNKEATRLQKTQDLSRKIHLIETATRERKRTEAERKELHGLRAKLRYYTKTKPTLKEEEPFEARTHVSPLRNKQKPTTPPKAGNENRKRFTFLKRPPQRPKGTSLLPQNWISPGFDIITDYSTSTSSKSKNEKSSDFTAKCRKCLMDGIVEAEHALSCINYHKAIVPVFLNLRALKNITHLQGADVYTQQINLERQEVGSSYEQKALLTGLQNSLPPRLAF